MTAPDPAARAALFRRLPRDGFVPPADLAPWSAAARAAAFAAEVEAFAAAFWSLVPDERRKRFDALWNARYGPAAAWLSELAAGLGLSPEAQPDPTAAAAVRLIHEWFVLQPRERATRRAEWLRAHDGDMRWPAAIRAVAASDPQLAGLEPRLLDWVTWGLWPTVVTAENANLMAQADGVGRNPEAVRRGEYDELLTLLFGSAIGVVFALLLASHKPAQRPGQVVNIPSAVTPTRR